MNLVNSIFGIVGIGAMGKNLSLNFLDHKISISAFDISKEQLTKLKVESKSSILQTFTDIDEFLISLEKPRKILIMLKAGTITRQPAGALQVLHLDSGDILIDGGNQHYEKTNSIMSFLKNYKINYIGAGVSGGTKGARYGPSIMPGGDVQAWKLVKPFLQDIAAKTDDNKAVS